LGSASSFNDANYSEDSIFIEAPETRITEQLRFDWSQLTSSAETELLIDMDYEAMMSNLDVDS